MKPNRPVNLDLTSLKFPPMAIASILHRISGVLLFLLSPIILWLFAKSLRDEATFVNLQYSFNNFFIKFILWAFAASLFYHLLAGIRHMILDLGFGEELLAARRSALTVIVLSAVCTILLGIWIW